MSGRWDKRRGGARAGGGVAEGDWRNPGARRGGGAAGGAAGGARNFGAGGFGGSRRASEGDDAPGVSGGAGARAGRFGGAAGADVRFRKPASVLRDEDNAFDVRMAYARVEEGGERVGYLLNMLPTTLVTEDRFERSALDMFFLQQDGTTFKATSTYEPYFYVGLAPSAAHRSREVVTLLEKKFEGLISSVSVVDKEDLQMLNHLSGRMRSYLQLRFRSVGELIAVKGQLKPDIDRNAARAASGDLMDEDMGGRGGAGGLFSSTARGGAQSDALSLLVEMREYDVPYYQRVSIDCDIRVGSWYAVKPARHGATLVTKLPEKVDNPEARVLAWDIETTKAPLKFPDPNVDLIYMVSYMLDGKGYLLINREVVADDVPDFEYTPSAEYPGPFEVHNLADEKEVIKAFFAHIQRVKPSIFVTYNGDFFDWPFLEKRSAVYGLDMRYEIGIWTDGNGEYRGRTAAHMDCLYWVKRDSYLPQGSHGLKSVTKAKLGYDPVEIDPEEMLTMARDNARHMASYSVSDAVATYYLYMKYVHAFIFSLCTIIPLGPDDVLRKGSGTLCESLLMVKAYKNGIICPNKQVDALGNTYHGHLLEAETYLGGHVECLESGVFRNDLPTTWHLTPSAFTGLIDKIDQALTFAIEVEAGVQRSDVVNYDEVRSSIIEKLELLRDMPTRIEKPVIYHLDVAAMYPNIILTNRLEPSAMVNEDICAACEYNDPANRCKRDMQWRWRGEHFPATKEEVDAVRFQLSGEVIDGKPFVDMSLSEQVALLKARVKVYSQRAYKRMKDTVEEDRTATVCQRENPFYVDTVRAFRDRRYEYKGLTKKWTRNVAVAEKAGNKLDAEVARARVVLYDSLQLAHKCILNSFYGYVMRKGARWHSMEMAGVVTYTGSKLIQQARVLVEQVGRPLEIDTDGIWCVLPASFPQNFAFKTKDGAKLPISYPCVMLNADVHERYTNHQYQDLMDPVSRNFSIRSECSIFFELDGPHAAMVLPASQEEGKLLKKRYAVFARDGTLSELKGFELKRRGELKMVKIFQSQVFERFLEGDSLPSCYAAVAEVADYWLDILDTQGEDLDDAELIEYLSENRSLTRTVEDYGEQKSVALSTAKRLAEFLGADMVKDKGLACKLLVAKKPAGAPVTERAIPTTIFEAEPTIREYYLRKWCKDNSMTDFNIRSILDWDYYRTRLGATIQKIITIPAALQRVPNPVPRVAHPDWLASLVAAKLSSRKQTALSSYFSLAGSGSAAPPRPALPAAGDDASERAAASPPALVDIEDMSAGGVSAAVRGAGHGHALPGSATVHTVVHTEEEAADVVSAPPAPPLRDDTQIADWLASRKASWKEARLAVKRKRLEQAVAAGLDVQHMDGMGDDALATSAASRRPATAARRTTGGRIGAMFAGMGAGASVPRALHAPSLDDMIADRCRLPARGYWQIVEIRDNSLTGFDDPGSFTVFAFTAQRKCASFTLNVPRVLFVNRFTPDTGALKAISQPVQRRLPHDAESHYLYQVTLPERRYQRHMAGALAHALDDPSVAGVYETRTPLLLRALLTVGCVAQVQQTHASLSDFAASRAARAARVAQEGGGGAGSSSYTAAQERTQPRAAAGDPLEGSAAEGRDAAQVAGKSTAVQPLSDSTISLSRTRRDGVGSVQTLRDLHFAASRPSVLSTAVSGSDDAAVIAAASDASILASLGAPSPGAPAGGATGTGNTYFDLDELELLTTTTHPYLVHFSATYRLAFLYHSSTASEAAAGVGHPAARAVTILFLFKETSTALVEGYMRSMLAHLSGANDGSGALPTNLSVADVNELVTQANAAVPGKHMPLGLTAHAFVVGAAPAAAPGSARAAAAPLPPFNRIFDAIVKASAAHPASTCEFHGTHMMRQADVWRRVSTLLAEAAPQSGAPRSTPLLLLTAANIPKQSLLRLVPATSAFPVIAAPFMPADCAYPAMAWSSFGAVRACIALLKSLAWWHVRLEASRYCQVPVGNLLLTDADGATMGGGASGAAATEAGDFAGSGGAASALSITFSDPTLATRMADLFYARMLQYNKHVLWASPSAIPDLGGLEASANSAQLLAMQLPSVQATRDAPSEDATKNAASAANAAAATAATSAASYVLPSINPSLSFPGLYRSVCVDLRLEHLAVNTVLNSGSIADIEGSDPLASFEALLQSSGDDAAAATRAHAAAAASDARAFQSLLNVSASTTDSGSCVGAFRALKRLVANWFTDYQSAGNALAGILLQRFYAWLASSDSLLHDPALHKLVHTLMRKTFDLLLRQLRASGVSVVYASFTRIVIATGKPSVPTAAAHVRHVLSKIAAQPLFAYLTVTPVVLWRTLLFLNDSNYVGVQAHGELEQFLNAMAGPQADAAASAAAASRLPVDDDDEAEAEEGTRGRGPADVAGAHSVGFGSAAEVSDKWARIFLVTAHEQGGSDAHAGTLHGSSVDALPWSDMESQFVADVTAPLVLDSHWTIADYLHPEAKELLELTLNVFMLRPIRHAARRRFKRLAAKFQAYIDTTSASSLASSSVHISAHSAARSSDGAGERVDAERVATFATTPHKAGAHRGTVTPSRAPPSSSSRVSLPALRNVLRLTSAAEEAEEEAADSDFMLTMISTYLRDKLVQSVEKLEASKRERVVDEEEAWDAILRAANASARLARHRSGGGDLHGDDMLDAADAAEEVSDVTVAALRHARRTASAIAHAKSGHQAAHLHSFSRPALAFVAATCALLSLDDRIRDEVMRVRSTLLAMLNVGEFSMIATFSDPCATIILPDVVCKACSHVRDLDIARDRFTTFTAVPAPAAHVLYEEDAPAHSSRLVPRFRWHCEACQVEYSDGYIEAELVKQIEARSVAYQVQDVYCIKCARARSSPMRAHCECSGRFVNAEPPVNFAHTLRVFKGMAEVYGFTWLRDTVEFMLTAECATA